MVEHIMVHGSFLTGSMEEEVRWSFARNVKNVVDITWKTDERRSSECACLTLSMEYEEHSHR